LRAYHLYLDADTSVAELVGRAAQDDSFAIRRWALQSLRQLPRLHANAGLVERFLLDDNLLQRQTAQLIARGSESPVDDVATFYRARLAQGTHGAELRATLFGLGETGTASDAKAIVTFISHQRTIIRRAALYALSWLDVEGNLDSFLHALSDARSRVSNDAANNLMRHVHLVSCPIPKQVVELLESGDYLAVDRAPIHHMPDQQAKTFDHPVCLFDGSLLTRHKASGLEGQVPIGQIPGLQAKPGYSALIYLSPTSGEVSWLGWKGERHALAENMDAFIAQLQERLQQRLSPTMRERRPGQSAKAVAARIAILRQDSASSPEARVSLLETLCYEAQDYTAAASQISRLKDD